MTSEREMDVEWTRHLPWRQASVLPDDAVKQLGVVADENLPDACVVVISHDCDLANDNLSVEPDVEVIVGRCLPKGNGNFYWAKSPRTLHLDARQNGSDVVIELVATAKRCIPKRDLAPFVPDESWILSARSLSVLRSWLAVRYSRAAFPDDFVDCLSKAKVDKALAKLVEPHGGWLSTVYFDLDQGEIVDHSDGSPYRLAIVLVYVVGDDDPEMIAQKMDDLADEVSALFEKRFCKSSAWQGVELSVCMAISEDDITVSRARLLTQWRLEYMTLRADGENPLPPG